MQSTPLGQAVPMLHVSVGRHLPMCVSSLRHSRWHLWPRCGDGGQCAS